MKKKINVGNVIMLIFVMFIFCNTTKNAQAKNYKKDTHKLTYEWEGKTRVFKIDYYQPKNAGDTDVWIILPGLTGDRKDYSGLAKTLAKHDKVVSINYYGLPKYRSHVFSAKRKALKKRGGTTSLIDGECEAVMGFVKKLEYKNIHVIGNSLGTYIGFIFSARNPKIKTLTMISTCPIFAMGDKKADVILKKAYSLFPGRNILIFEGKKDYDRITKKYGPQLAKHVMNKLPEETTELCVYKGNYHSFKLLSRYPKISKKIYEWKEKK